MASHKQAEKRARQNLSRRLRNRFQKTTMRTAIKQVRTAIAQGDASEAQRLLRAAVSHIASTASKNAIHRNKAARTISRLTKAVSGMN